MKAHSTPAKMRNNIIFFILNVLLTVLAIILVAAFVATMVSEAAEQFLYKLTGLSPENKYGLLQNLIILMGAVPIALQAIASHRRSIAMETTAHTQAEANLQIEKGQRQERLKHAVEHLGHASGSVRIAGTYELLQLAKDSEYLRETVLEILCAHIRHITTTTNYMEKHSSSPTTEVQSILKLLFVDHKEYFRNFRPNLEGSCLNRINLAEAVLIDANLDGVRLQYANLHKADLRGARLMHADLRNAILARAELSGTKIIASNLQRAILRSSRLRGSTLISARFQLSDLSDARLQGAQVRDVSLQEASLQGALLHGVHPMPTRDKNSLQFIDIITDAIGQPSDLYELVLRGGMGDDDMKRITEGLSVDNASRTRQDMATHLGAPRSSESSGLEGFVTGTYAQEDAERWIAEYPKTGIPGWV